jgi:hypothetical protein
VDSANALDRYEVHSELKSATPLRLLPSRQVIYPLHPDPSVLALPVALSHILLMTILLL